MMVPFDGTATTTQQSSQHGAPHPPLNHGHHGSQAPPVPQQHHGQSINAGYQHPNLRQASGGMQGGPNFSIPPSPSSRQNSFGGVPGGSGHYQHSSHHAMRSPTAHQQMMGQQSHPQHMGIPSGPVQHSNMGSVAAHDNRQRNYIATGMNGNWQSDKDMPHRREMIQQIVKMLKKDKNGSPEWLNKLPQMAKQLEVSLYRNARSFEDYMDMSTLKQRLQLIAMEVSRKARTQSGDRTVSSGNNDRRSETERSNNTYSGGNMHSVPDMMRGSSQSGSAQSQYINNQGPLSSATHQSRMGQQQMQSQHHSQVSSIDDLKVMGPGSSVGGNEVIHHQPTASYMGPPSRSAMNDPNAGRSSSDSGNTTSTTLPQKNDSEWKIRIRHKQQRLLLLHHSAKCPHENGACTVTPHCADMKRLWKHMEGCKDNNCRVPHCFSSRAILSHYRKCKDPQCPACGPVRETVMKAARTGSSSRTSTSSRSRYHQIMTGGSQNPNLEQLNLSPSTTPGQGLSSDQAMLTSSGSGTGFGSSSMNFPPQQVRRPGSLTTTVMPPPVSGSKLPSGVNYPMSSFSAQGTSASSAQSVPQELFGVDQHQPNGEIGMLSDINDAHSTTGSLSTSAAPDPSASGKMVGSRRDSTEWQKVRHKQQRLLLLRHASKCQHEAGKCPVTPHCASMKKLWEHIAHCKNQQCTVQHCMSSRYVLSHYRRCKDPRCPACGPVRETIRKSHEKEILQHQTEIGPSSASRASISSSRRQPSPGASSNEPIQKRSKLNQSGSSLNQAMSIADSKTEHSSLPSITSASSKVADVIVAAPEKPSQSGKMDDHSLLNSLTTEEIELHLASLHKAVQLPPAKLKAKCGEVLKGLQSHNHGWVFNTPVDPVELGLPDYFEIIKKPMDLGTVSKKLDNGAYHFITEFAADVKLTFDNAMTYNEEGSVVHDMAKELMIKFLADYKKLMAQLEAEDREARRNDRACTLCGCEKLLFEPPVFFCNGMNCQSKRIRRNSHFYVGGNGQYFWCNQCHNELDGSIPIELGDISIMKNDLKKKKNDEVHEESWVQCDECESWIHQICGLFNTRQNKEHHSKYFCPKCLIRRRKSGVPPSPRPPSAADLPRTKLSEYLERHIHCKVAEKKAQLVQDRGDSEKAPMSKALKALECGDIIIRQVTATDRKLEVRELMKKRYAHKNYPEEFPFRCKCIVVFQKIDGVDVILFALYVYEHGSDNPPPNRRCVYISYLDSVHFMRPRRLRTYVYHELLVCYLDYARQKGFSTAHIWACPPLKGDDYIFYCKPEDQKTPRDARLRQWYIEMLTECQRRNICGKVTNMYDLYIADETLDATALPYLEGDYFPGEAENIIKELEEGGCKKGSTGGKKSKKKSSKSKGRGSRPDDDSPWGEEPTSPKGFLEGGRDDVMVKLGETIHPMKDSFIVAFLNWSGAREEDMKVPDEIVEYRQESESTGIAEQERINRKRDSQGNAKDDVGSTEKVIDDDDEDMDCEFLNNRQAFLNLCRGNHYQFDELRRAKHTSMMVLWHLHNRDAPKFVQQCAACSREILSGTRYHCNVCPDYDLCEDCFRNPNTIRGSCKHNLIPMAVENNSEGQGGGTSGLTEEQRRERQRNLQLHIQLIEHASRCISSSCNSSNCAKMKTYLQHGRTCKLKASGGCKICKRIWTLLRIHAQKCKDAVCPIPQCMAIRERLRQLAKQQQAMDDRRRQEMNRAFRMSLVANQGG